MNRGRIKTILATLLWAGCSFVFLWSSWTCKEDITGGQPIDVVFPDSNVSFGQHVQPLFIRGCAFSGCHGADRYAEDGYSLDSYEHLMFGTRAVVFRGDPENSLLIQSIEGANQVVKMPPRDFPQLNENQVRGMRKWVAEGAQNN
jgi:hypothetical protein